MVQTTPRSLISILALNTAFSIDANQVRNMGEATPSSPQVAAAGINGGRLLFLFLIVCACAGL